MFKIFEKIISNSIKEQRFENQKNIQLKPGIKVYAKVIKTNGDKALLDLKGLKILAVSNRELKAGEIVKLEVLKVRENEIFVKLAESETMADTQPEVKEIDIKKLLLSLSIEEKIFLKNHEIDDILKKYKSLAEKTNDTSLLKALLVAEKLERTNPDIISSLKAYYDGEIRREKLKVDDKLSENLKRELDKIISGREASDRGMNILNKLNGDLALLSFLFAIENLLKPLSMSIKKYKKKEIENRKIYDLIIKTEFNRLGMVETHILIKETKVFLHFYFEKIINRDKFIKNMEKYRDKFKIKGFVIEDISLSTKLHEEHKVGNINIRG